MLKPGPHVFKGKFVWVPGAWSGIDGPLHPKDFGLEHLRNTINWLGYAINQRMRRDRKTRLSKRLRAILRGELTRRMNKGVVV